MSRRRGFAALCAVAVAVAAPSTRAHAQLFSPGPLSRAHAELEGDAHCEDCHSSGRQVSERKCLSCHDALAARVRARRGLHGGEYRGRPCERCHVEHLGRRAPQVRWPGGNRDRFDHDLAGWPLRGAHARQGCDDCHGRGGSFLGLRSACASCHEDPHGGRFGTACQDCHGETRWGAVRLDAASFDHGRTRFPLRGRHQQVACEGCHHEPPRYRGIAFERCTSCHEDPHGGSYGATCTDCHSEAGWDELGRVRRNHPGLSLGGGHRRVRCSGCHDRGVSASPSRGRRCVSCHRPVHEAPFGNDCASCHRGIRWHRLPERVSLAAHARTAFPLAGAHGSVDCARCHDPHLGADARYRELEFERCGACHEDPHRGSFSGWGEASDCAACHRDAAFWPSTFSVALHARADYPLEGRHAAVACSGCHGAARPRTTFEVADTRCVDCHANPHGDQFAAEMADAGCAGCHSPAGFDRVAIEHTRWPLTGAHAEAACDRCHRPTEEDRRTGGGASYRGAPRVCAGCHLDVHAGQFRLSAPIRHCPDCHDTRAFSIVPFDHEEVAGFALEGGHAELACGACHPTERLGRALEAVRYRLGYDRCSDCHANPHAPPRGAPAPTSLRVVPDGLLLAWLEAQR